MGEGAVGPLFKALDQIGPDGLVRPRDLVVKIAILAHHRQIEDRIYCAPEFFDLRMYR
jgi:hypothetical protein